MKRLSWGTIRNACDRYRQLPPHRKPESWLMKFRSSKRLGRKATLASLVAVLASLTLLAPSPAQAASWNAISGSTYSEYNVWYYSSNQRFKVGEGQVQAKFTKVPNYSSGLPDGLWLALVDLNNNTLYGSVFHNASNTAKNQGLLPAGQGFKNAFTRAHTCYNCNHDFTGQEYY